MRAEQILPDDVNQAEIAGVLVRKGTVGAFLHNAKAWCDPQTPEPEQAEVELDILAAIPAWRALGVFDVMALRDDRLRGLVEAHAAGGAIAPAGPVHDGPADPSATRPRASATR